MKISFRYLCCSLLILVVGLTNSVFASQSLFVYRDFAHKGDENQVLGVITALQKNQQELVVSHYNIGDEEKLKSAVQAHISRSEQKPILLAVGEKTVDKYAQLLPVDGALTLHLCHMITKNHSQLIDKIDYIVLPTHAVGDFANHIEGTRTKLIETIGVSHNRQLSEIKAVYGKFGDEIPQSDRYYGIILSGDAPTPSGEIKLFTEENVKQLARYVANSMSDGHLLIINGPRTGKHDKNLIENKLAHRNDQVDFITQAFIDELLRLNVKNDQFTLFDFQFLKPSPQDMNIVLGAVNASDGLILVPGESTSSISESIDVLPKGSVIVYDSTSMNSVHQAHVQSEFDVGRIKHLSLSDIGYTLPLVQSNESAIGDLHSAAETIATAIIDDLKNPTN